jgi:hypothetical protein
MRPCHFQRDRVRPDRRASAPAGSEIVPHLRTLEGTLAADPELQEETAGRGIWD